MRTIYVATSFLALIAATPAFGQEIEVSGEVRAMTSYVDDRLFNQEFSTEPLAQFSILAEADNGLYVEVNVLSGFNRPLRDSSSELRLEVGWEREIAQNLTLNVAGGRYDNYGGAGLGTGDTFGRVGIRYQDTSVAVSYLAGETDAAIAFVEHELEVGKFTIIPSISWNLTTGDVNPGARASYRITDTASIEGVVGSRNAQGERDLVASVGVAVRF